LSSTYLLGQTSIEGVKNGLAVFVVVPDNDAFIEIHYVDDVGMSFLPGDLVDTDGFGSRWWHKEIISFFLENCPVDSIDNLVIEFKKTTGLGVSGNGGKPVHMLGETPGEATVRPGQMSNMNTPVRAAALAFLKIEKHPAAKNM
jgi:hypothetical protein